MRSRDRLRTAVVFGSVFVALVFTEPGCGASSTQPKPGDEPSTARVAVPGNTYHGNNASQTPDKSGYYSALWKVRLRRETEVTISWSQPPSGHVQLNVLPEVTDRTWANQEPLTSSNTGPNGHVAFVFIAATTGWYYLDFGVTQKPGPYSFSLGRPRRDCHDFGC